MAFVYEYGKGRVFQTVLGHDAAAIRVPGTSYLIRRGAVWTAGRPQGAVEPVTKEPAAAPGQTATVAGRFDAAVDPRLARAVVEFRPTYPNHKSWDARAIDRIAVNVAKSRI